MKGDGQITEEDFVLSVCKAGLGSIGETAIKQVFRQMDTNKNGKLEFDEAVKVWDLVKKLNKK